MRVIKHQIVDVDYGESVTVVEPVNIYGCKLADHVFVGPFTEIQKNVSVGEKTKIQSHTFVCEFVNIGANCFIGHGVMFINDLFQSGRPAGGDTSKWRSTEIRDNVSIGSNATVLPVTICEGTVIGAGAVVTKDITTKGIYAGNPAKLIRKL
ncbi:UDP-3-O-(3-hydroxymyristoyl)glucosamine N-acyltransferase [Roseivirga sp. 4D4]|uniref:acyltransferase n=1 Tax=Roseivirga sp. 4D4 TaxID=1889784 RepID=UPI0008536031|nr:acyltransferase [Roseivirga sp. 4D4]OEK02491.1 UDP-3-O-(3-hydroxymyristoyl)glucosamine N-acyltransferase [Roseivirga sp. 4D4]